MPPNYLRLILIGLCAVFGAPMASAQGPAPDSAQVLRRVATTARLAAEEYRLGVRDGKVILEPEVEEARLFLTEARRAAAGLPEVWAGRAAAALEQLLTLVAATGSPDSLTAGVEELVTGLARDLSVELDEIPDQAPSLARGADVYRQVCAACHGVVGRADGPLAAGLDPPPSRLSEAEVLAGSSPLDFYRRVTIGVAGTAMPAYETLLSPGDRWAVALYASTLRLPSARGRVPPALADFSTTARMSDEQVIEALGGGGLPRVAAVRAATGSGRGHAATFALVRARIDSSVALAEAGQTAEAQSRALDAYMAFEGVEKELRVREPALVASLERGFSGLRTAADAEAAGAAREPLLSALERAERALGGNLTPLALFLQSFVILVREGLEAILVVGALIAFLVKLGAGERRRDIYFGVGAALGASILTAIAIETVFRLSPAHQEALEAVTMVVATVMLFWVSYWLLSKIEVARWSRFVRTRLSEALGRRSTLALASVAFLAVYREGFETVLFYKALVVSGGSGPVGGPIALGFVAGAAVLAVIFVAVNRFGVRLPLRPFFAVTSAFLYLMAFNFAGTAIAELQEGGFLSLTPVHWLPRVPALGMYPTVESALAQALLLALAAAAVVWTFVVSPRRAESLARS